MTKELVVTENNQAYDYLILFEHKNINIVKAVMRFLAHGCFFSPLDDDNVMVVDFPDLYKHGMKSKDFIFEAEKT